MKFQQKIMSLTLLAILFCICGSGYASSINVSGEVSGTWDADTVFVDSEITIPNGETLSIGPGVYVEFQGHYKFNVQGRLLAIGAETDLIHFTIFDTTGFSVPNSFDGAWHGIRFIETAATNDSSKIMYCKLEFGKAFGYSPPTDGSGGAICLVNFSKLHISNSLIRNNIAMVGGGIAFEDNAGAILENSTIINNYSSSGGGIYCLSSSSPILNNVSISSNISGDGGGMACWYYCNPELRNVVFDGNSSDVHGGGLYCKFGSSPYLYNVTFSNNSASYGGGLNCNGDSNPRLENVIIIGNKGSNSSGALSCGDNANPVLVNATIYGNTSIYGPGVSYIYDSNPVFVNTIIWGNSPQEIYFTDYEQYSQSILIAYSDVQGGQEIITTNNNGTVYWQEGNIDDDPLFVEDDNNFLLQPGSPCIDAGTAFFEWMGNTVLDLSPDEYDGSAPDMGAYEYYYPTNINDDDISISSTRPELYQNYPNPWLSSSLKGDPGTTIRFSLSKPVVLSLSIFDVSGRLVKTLVNDEKKLTGYSSINWDGKNEKGFAVGSGIYFYSLVAEGFKTTRRMTILK